MNLQRSVLAQSPGGTAGQSPTAPPGGGFQPDARGRGLPSSNRTNGGVCLQ